MKVINDIGIYVLNWKLFLIVKVYYISLYLVYILLYMRYFWCCRNFIRMVMLD